MEESTTRERTTGKDGKKEVDQVVLMSGKPLHRFVQREPRCLGIAIVIIGCAEILMGFNEAGATCEEFHSSSHIYTPFWQGVLFLACGNLSIYTEIHPSTKMVTVCLAMYLVTLIGIIVSGGYSIYCYLPCEYGQYRPLIRHCGTYRLDLHCCNELFLFATSLCVLGILIFLCVIACLALKSTRTQVIVQHLPRPQSVGTSN